MDTDSELLLTIFLEHDQTQNLDGLQSRLAERDWWGRFPPPGIAIDSWYVVMGLGQIVTLRLPASRLAEVNVEIERSAWGPFRTRMFPAYDFVPVRERIKARVAGSEKRTMAGAGSGSSGVDIAREGKT